MRRFILAVFTMTVLVACQPATTELTEEQKAEIAAEATAINEVFWDAWRAADFEQGMSYFHNSPDLTFALDGTLIHGYDGVDATFRPVFAGVVSQVITIPDSRTFVLAPDVVCIMESGSYKATDTAGVATPELGFAVTTVWKHQGGEWKVRQVHESYPPTESQ